MNDLIAGVRLPDWLLSLLLLAGFALAALAVHQAVVLAVRKALSKHQTFWRAPVQRTRRPSRLAALIICLAVGVNAAQLTSARNAGQAFDLRCEVREKMIAFLRAEHPEALPRDRFDLRPYDGADRQSPTARNGPERPSGAYDS